MKPLLALLLILSTGIALAASIYKYECPKCHLIQQYGTPGIHKCPQDGWTLIPILSK
jgi:hypothetical protein